MWTRTPFPDQHRRGGEPSVHYPANAFAESILLEMSPAISNGHRRVAAGGTVWLENFSNEHHSASESHFQE